MPRVRIHVTGIVQGVGYRPFVWRAAAAAGVAGWVCNASDGVHIEAEGDQGALDAFVLALSTQRPPAAHVDAVQVERVREGDGGASRGDVADGGASGGGFRIVESDPNTAKVTLVSPDIATCPDCLAEMLDPRNRRYHYPFINCTNCGPRFTIIDSLPYDRPGTSMAPFAMCPECAREYADPADRRFHAQPDACFECGPHIFWRTAEEPGVVERGRTREESDAIVGKAAGLLLAGGVVAVKGLGGFHLACDATNERAVARLRERKRRPSKPLAVMFERLDHMRRVVEVDDAERAQVTSPSRPIVLLRRKPDDEVPARLRMAPSVAGDLPELGAMLPYTPLQHLLLRAAGVPLVMTSGNLSDEPIVCDDQVAVARLMDVADAWVGNDRRIVARYDDSVVRVEDGRVQTVRRARGIAPTPVRLSAPAGCGVCGGNGATGAPGTSETPGVPEVLACGPEQKATFCLTRGDLAFVSQHIGDLENAESFDAWLQALDRYTELFDLAPKALACDAHPEYLSSKWARGQARERGLPLFEVQHHHAHIAAALAERDERGKVVGVALDGTGYGLDGAIWGCEVMVCDQAEFVRAAHLAYWRLPGGAAAVRKPARNAYALLDGLGMGDGPLAARLLESMGVEGPVVRQMLARDLNCPRAGTAGRLFDAVAAMLGVCTRAGYEGEPACLLEAAAQRALAAVRGAGPGEGTPGTDGADDARYLLELRRANPADRHAEGDGSLVLDPGRLIRAAAEDVEAGVNADLVALRFHRGFADGVAGAAAGVARAAGIGKVALGGGVFANRLVLARVSEGLARAGLEVLAPSALPFNDGGVSYGQAAVARARMARGMGGASSAAGPDPEPAGPDEGAGSSGPAHSDAPAPEGTRPGPAPAPSPSPVQPL